jgi:hypothetical protein
MPLRIPLSRTKVEFSLRLEVIILNLSETTISLKILTNSTQFQAKIPKIYPSLVEVRSTSRSLLLVIMMLMRLL